MSGNTVFIPKNDMHSGIEVTSLLLYVYASTHIPPQAGVELFKNSWC